MHASKHLRYQSTVASVFRQTVGGWPIKPPRSSSQIATSTYAWHVHGAAHVNPTQKHGDPFTSAPTHTPLYTPTWKEKQTGQPGDGLHSVRTTRCELQQTDSLQTSPDVIRGVRTPSISSYSTHHVTYRNRMKWRRTSRRQLTAGTTFSGSRERWWHPRLRPAQVGKPRRGRVLCSHTSELISLSSFSTRKKTRANEASLLAVRL